MVERILESHDEAEELESFIAKLAMSESGIYQLVLGAEISVTRFLEWLLKKVNQDRMETWGEVPSTMTIVSGDRGECADTLVRDQFRKIFDERKSKEHQKPELFVINALNDNIDIASGVLDTAQRTRNIMLQRVNGPIVIILSTEIIEGIDRACVPLYPHLLGHVPSCTVTKVPYTLVD